MLRRGITGFLSVSDSDRRVPAELGQESQASSCLRKGTPLASRVVQGDTGTSSSCVWNPRVFPDDARGCQCRLGLCLHPQGCLLRGVRHRVLLKSGPGNRGRSTCGTTHVAHFKCPRETGLLLRCARKAGNPFQTCRGIDSPVALRRGEGAQMKRCRDPRCSPRGNQACRGTFGVT